MEIALRILSSALVIASTSVLAKILYPKISKIEKNNERIAKSKNIVKLDSGLSIAFVVLLIFVNAVGILIIALPKVITEYLEFNYVVTLCVWWLPIVFDDILSYFLFMQAIYDDEKITVKKLFSKPKEYLYCEITDFTKSGNLKVKTTNGNFTLFATLAGTKSLREVITEKVTNVGSAV